jgi:hypothetical protein
MAGRLLLIAVFSVALANLAFANCSLIRRRVVVVDIEPTGTGVTKVGKEVYQTQEQADADAKRLCNEPKANVPREPKNAE